MGEKGFEQILELINVIIIQKADTWIITDPVLLFVCLFPCSQTSPEHTMSKKNGGGKSLTLLLFLLLFLNSYNVYMKHT